MKNLCIQALLAVTAMAIEPADLELLAKYTSSDMPHDTMRQTFKQVALAESRAGREKTIEQIVAELQVLNPDYASEIARDENFWKLSFLLDNGWRIEVPNKDGANLLVAVLETKHEPCVDLVLKMGGYNLYSLKEIPGMLAAAGLGNNPRFVDKLKRWKNKSSRTALLFGEPANYNFEGVSRRDKVVEKKVDEDTEPTVMAPAPTTKARDFTTVDVFYATNRAYDATFKGQLKKTDAVEKFYSFTSIGALSYGIAKVTIPKTHKRGKLEERGFFQFKRDPKKHVILQELTLQTPAQFFGRLREEIQGRQKAFESDAELREAAGHLFVYIHGFNADFSYAMRKTAQLMYDMDYPGTSVAFSWPARAVKLPLPVDFRSDISRAEDSYASLQEFLTKIREDFPGHKIHVLAHSLGTRVLMKVLTEIAKGSEGTGAVDRAKLFGEIILAAPAIDAEEFINDLAPHVLPLCDRVSIFASDDDAALKVQCLGENLKSFPLGLLSKDRAAVPNGVLNIDVSDLSAGTFSLDHSVYGDVEAAIDLMARLLKFQPSRDVLLLDTDSGLKEFRRADFFSPNPERSYLKLLQ